MLKSDKVFEILDEYKSLSPIKRANLYIDHIETLRDYIEKLEDLLSKEEDKKLELQMDNTNKIVLSKIVETLYEHGLIGGVTG